MSDDNVIDLPEVRPPAKPIDDPETAGKLIAASAMEKAIKAHEAKKTAQREAKQAPEITVAGHVIARWEEEKGKLVRDRDELRHYSGGVWRRVDKNELEVQVFAACIERVAPASSSFISSVVRLIRNHPNLTAPEGTEWDSSGLVIAIDKCIDPATGNATPHSQMHMATGRVEARLDGSLATPRWDAFLNRSFSNLAEPARDATIATLQEWFGAALVRGKARELRKAMLVYGPSRTGKTQLAAVMRALVAGRIATISALDLESRFGMAGLVDAAAWIADDAVSSGQKINGERLKVLTTGEPVAVPRKYRDDWSGSVDIPILLTSNHLPAILDHSDAPYNRCLLMPMNAVCSEAEAAQISKTNGGVSVSEAIIRHELGGVLHWAIRGWRRLAARGVYGPPEVITDALAQFKSDNDPLGQCLSDVLAPAEWIMVDRRDIAAAVRAWWTAEFGLHDRVPSGRAVIPAIRSKFDRVGEHKIRGILYATGVELTELGIQLVENLRNDTIIGSVGSGAAAARMNRKMTRQQDLDV